MSVCSTCRGYGLARGGSCWTCNGGGSEPDAEGFSGHLVTPKDGGRPTFYAAGEDFTLTTSATVTPLYAHSQRLTQALEAAGELANLCVFPDTGRVCPYCKCERREVSA